MEAMSVGAYNVSKPLSRTVRSVIDIVVNSRPVPHDRRNALRLPEAVTILAAKAKSIEDQIVASTNTQVLVRRFDQRSIAVHQIQSSRHLCHQV